MVSRSRSPLAGGTQQRTPQEIPPGIGRSTGASHFRLDSVTRRALTERTLTEHHGGVPRPLIEAIAATLDAGAAIFAVLQTDPTATVLEDAVTRCGSQRIADEPVDARHWRMSVRSCARL
jgi:hypothetical protein